MLLAYTAGPYRDKRGEWYVHQNIQKASEVAVELWKMGYSVICPHRNTAMFGGACSDDVWLTGDLVMLERCDLIVVLPGWGASSGTLAEIEHAKYKDIPVYYWESEDDRAFLRNLR